MTFHGRDEDPLITVLGPHRYAVLPRWNRVRLGRVSQVAVDRRGRVYAFQRTGSPVVVLSPEGEVTASWGGGLIRDAHGIAITPDDRVLLVDRDCHQILICDLAGKLISTIGERHRPRFGRPFNHPTDIAVAPNGDFYVSDGYGNAHVHCFSPDGAHKLTWGGVGTGEGEFSTPHGIWVTGTGDVLVGDRENDRVQVFDAAGRFKASWGTLYHPMDIWGAPDGTIFVTDQAPRIVAFAADGRILGRAKAVATLSHGIWGAPDGSLFLCETDGWLTKMERLPA